jgi:hypothetical protein
MKHSDRSEDDRDFAYGLVVCNYINEISVMYVKVEGRCENEGPNVECIGLDRRPGLEGRV